MIRQPALWVIGLVFVVSAAFNTRVNSLPRFNVTPAVITELAALLAANGLQTRPMPEPRGLLLQSALRFALPACDADGFLLPVADTQLTHVQAARFAEITGAAYNSFPQRMTLRGGILGARAERAVTTFRAAIGLTAMRNGHTVLVTFLPKGCNMPLPDLRTFWSATDHAI